MSEQPELFGGDELMTPPAPVSPDGLRGPLVVRDIAAVAEGPLKHLVNGNFLTYASYVIRDRAIPDVDDGLKPVQRRILHSLFENDDGKFIKVANIVGYSMQFHPHGDASIGDALVTLANKQYLIEGQGNFGNLFTGDPAAAPRYIECRLTELAREELFDPDLTDTVPTYDGRKEEPVSLPARIPLLLMLGADGIAVGLSTRILPHNFNELLEAQVAILQKRPFEVFPDFQQGGLMDAAGYDKGRGAVRVRARVEIRDASTLVVREVPFGANTDSLIASIEEAGRKGKLRLRSINDFTAGQVEIEIQLQEGESAARAIEALYAFTQCESQVASRIMVIRNGRPVEMDVEDVLRHNTTRLLKLLTLRLKVQQKRLSEELHRKTLVQVFVENRLYKAIESCASQEDVEQAVRTGLEPFLSALQRELTHADIELLLGIPIRRISQFDLAKNRKDMEDLRTELAESRENLANVTGYTVRYLRQLQKKYGASFPRRTAIEVFRSVEVRELTATELAVNHDRAKGYLGHAIGGTPLFQCSSLDKLLLVWRDGRYKAISPPEKLFVDDTLIHCSVLGRERVLTVVYNEDGFTHIRKLLPNAITNREYRCIPRGAQIVFFSDQDVTVLYVQYDVPEAATIKQQEFDTAALPVRERDGKASLMSSKKIAYIGAAKPKKWDDALTGPKGTYMNF
jgi:topoisomerase-4 subunit A